jgi:hypothetical protein
MLLVSLCSTTQLFYREKWDKWPCSSSLYRIFSASNICHNRKSSEEHITVYSVPILHAQRNLHLICRLESEPTTCMVYGVRRFFLCVCNKSGRIASSAKFQTTIDSLHYSALLFSVNAFKYLTGGLVGKLTALLWQAIRRTTCRQV